MYAVQKKIMIILLFFSTLNSWMIMIKITSSYTKGFKQRFNTNPQLRIGVLLSLMPMCKRKYNGKR